MNAAPLTLDVRPALAAGHDPFATLMQAVSQLGSDQALLVIAPFEPTPLYAVLAQQGFAHQAEQAAPHEWHPVPVGSRNRQKRFSTLVNSSTGRNGDTQ